MHNDNNRERIIDVLYDLKSIRSIEDIEKRNIGLDLIKHLIGNVLAYRAGTKNSKNPLDYVTYSANLYEIASIKGLLEYTHRHNETLHEQLIQIMDMMKHLTDDMMVAAELELLSQFFDDNAKDTDNIVEHIDSLMNNVPKTWLSRCEEIKAHEMRTNSPEVRIKRLLKKRDELEEKGILDEPDTW